MYNQTQGGEAKADTVTKATPLALSYSFQHHEAEAGELAQA